MAKFYRTIDFSPVVGGCVIVTAIVALTGACLWQLASYGGVVHVDFYVLSLLWFSVSQAALSTILSLILGVMLGRAYVRRDNIIGMRLLARLFNGSFLLPVVVAVFGLIAVHGLSGWGNFIDRRYIYGFTGIIIAHVFFNAPLAARFTAQALTAVPEQHWRLAQQLGMLNMSPWRRFFLLDYPALRQVLWSAAALIFLLCFTSFAIVLILGSGLYATLEVAIYQALRLQFQPTQAAFLAFLQIAVCLVIAGALLLLGKSSVQGNDWRLHKSRYPRPDGVLLSARITDGLVWVVACALIVPVFVSLPVALLNDRVWAVLASDSFLQAVTGSLLIAPMAAVLSVAMAWGLAVASRHVKIAAHHRNWQVFFEVPGFLILMIPPLTLSAGLFLLFHRWGWVGDFSVSLAVVIVINALLALPFSYVILSPPLLKIAEQHNALALSLGLRGWRRWRLLELPLIRQPLGLALGLAAALSIGDVSAIALFGTQNFTNLPLLLYRLLGSYRITEAGIVGVALCVLLFVLFWSGHGVAYLITLRRRHVAR